MVKKYYQGRASVYVINGRGYVKYGNNIYQISKKPAVNTTKVVKKRVRRRAQPYYGWW